MYSSVDESGDELTPSHGSIDKKDGVLGTASRRLGLYSASWFIQQARDLLINKHALCYLIKDTSHYLTRQFFSKDESYIFYTASPASVAGTTNRIYAPVYALMFPVKNNLY